MSVCPSVTYTPYATSSKEKTVDIITFAQFEGEDLLYETREYAESSEESDDDSILPQLLRKEEMDTMDSGYESDHDRISTEKLEKIRDGSQSHPNVNQI